MRRPAGRRAGRRDRARAAVLGGFAASAVALAVSPALLPASYSWVANTTSEAAAQGVEGAWLARLGFLLFGLSVIATAQLRHEAWGGPATVLHGAFGVCMLAAAAFSTRSWQAGARFDHAEDLLHSIAATALGFAFALGVVAVALRRGRGAPAGVRAVDATAVAASVVLPVAMSLWGDLDGVLQRAMFLVAYCWYAGEVVRAYGAAARRLDRPG